MEDISTERPAESANHLVRGVAWASFAFVVLAGLAVVLIPVWIIRPFAPQSQQGLEWSYLLRTWSQTMTLITSALALALAVWLWRYARRWWRKSILGAFLAIAFASTWFARQNHFEWRFNPLTNAAYARVSDASFVSGADMVLP